MRHRGDIRGALADRPVAGALPSRIACAMLPARLLAAPAARLLAVALLAPASQARTVRLRGPGGFWVKAPKGFKVKAKKGIYRITGRGLKLTYARVPAHGMSPADTGAQLARAARAQATS